MRIIKSLFNKSSIFYQTVSNLSWLSADRIIRLFGAVLVNAWVTRYLGPENTGVLSYVLAFVGMFAPISILGLDSIIVRDIVRNPSQKDNILGTAFCLRIFGATCAIIFASITILLIKPNDYFIQLLVIINAIGLIFQSFDVIDYWFQSQIISKYTVYAKNLAFLLISVAKIFAILSNANVMIFIILTTLELLIAAIGLVIFFQKKFYRITKWRFNFAIAKSLLLNSWPIIISDIAIIAQSKIDQVMISHYLSNIDLGYYAAAQRISEPLGFIPMIFYSSIMPVMVKTKEWSKEEFARRLTNIYRIMFILTIATCLPIAIFSKQIVWILYGEKFAFSAVLLNFLIWLRFFGFFGVARNIFISTENLFKHLMFSSLLGITISVISNIVLLPLVGIYGAIISANLGYIASIFVLDAFAKQTRFNFKLMINGIITFYKASI